MKLCIIAFAALAIGCPPPSQPPASTDADAAQPPMADSADGCGAFCALLAAAGCPEGGIRCVSTCTHVVESRIVALPIDCVTHVHAVDVGEMRACGVACVQP